MGLSCPSVNVCVTVGTQDDYNMPLAEAWNGTAWTVMDTSEIGAGSVVVPDYTFNGVSCPSSTFCVAVGGEQVLNGQQAAAAWWGTAPSCDQGLLGDLNQGLSSL